MRRFLSSLVLCVACTIGLPLAQGSTRSADEAIVGTWSGTFDGDNAGKFSMAIARDAAAKTLGGTLETQFKDGGGYTATFKTVRVERGKVYLAYDPPTGDPVEVEMEATIEGAAIKGTWKVVDNASRNVGQTGAFAGAKQ